MPWEPVLATIAVLVMLEGLLAFVYPEGARRIIRRIADMSAAQWRLAGLVAVTFGVVLLTLLRLAD